MSVDREAAEALAAKLHKCCLDIDGREMLGDERPIGLAVRDVRNAACALPALLAERDAALARATAAEAREAKLREALATYACKCWGDAPLPECAQGHLADCGYRARAALAEPARPAAETEPEGER